MTDDVDDVVASTSRERLLLQDLSGDVGRDAWIASTVTVDDLPVDPC